MVDQLFDLRVTFVHDAQVRGAFQRFFDGHMQLHRDGFCHLVHLLVVHTHHSANVAYPAAGCHRAKGDDLCHPVLAVLLDDIVDDLFPAFIAEVDVKVGHTDPFRVEEALEQQIIFHRVDAGDANTVGSDAACAGASSRSNRYAVAFGVVDKVPDNQVIIDISHLFDDRQLILQTLPILLRRIRSIVPFKAFPAPFAEERHIFLSVWHLKARKDVVSKGKLHLTAAGNGDGVVQRLLDDLFVEDTLVHRLLHLLSTLDIKLLGFKLHPVVL